MFKFKNDEERLSEAELLLREDYDESHDRAVLSAFYNGRQTMTELEAAEQGLSELTNHLFGFDSLNMAKTQVESLYTKDPNMWEVHLKNVDPFDKQRLQFESTKKWNQIMKESKRFKGPWKGLAGDVTLYGQGCLLWTNPTDWCPILARPLVPRGTKTSADDIPFMVLPEYLSTVELRRIIIHAEALEAKGIDSGWNLTEIRKILGMLTANVANKYQHHPTLENTPHEDLEHMKQNNSDPSDSVRFRFPVFYFYERAEDAEMFDVRILARIKTTEKESNQDRGKTYPVTLFTRKGYYKKAKDLICPFFLDCNIGGETKWHRTMGLGRLNYENDLDVEDFFNEAMQGSKENVRRMYQVASSANMEVVDRWISDPAWSNVMPEGLNVVEGGKNPNFQYAMGILEQLQQASKINAGGNITNTGDKTVNELEVQAIARQGRNAAAVSSRMNDLYDDTKILGITIWDRFTNPSIREGSPGYAEISEFQQYCSRELGLSMAFLNEKNEQGKFKNVEIRPVRSAGDGDRVREVMVNRMLMERLHLFGPQAQRVILKRITATETQDHELAEILVPEEPKIAAEQTTRANEENNSAMLRGITGYVPQIADEDIDLEHIPEHVGGLSGAIAHARTVVEAGGIWSLAQRRGFQALGAHALQHIQRINQIPEQRQIGAQFTAQIQALASEADRLGQQSEEREQAGQMDQKELHSMQIAERKQGLAERAQLKLEEHRDETTALQRHKQGFEESARDEQLRQQQDQNELARAVAVNEARLKEKQSEQAQEVAEATPAQ